MQYGRDAQHVRSLLADVGWLPRDAVRRRWKPMPNENLLPSLRELWHVSGGNSTGRGIKDLEAKFSHRQSLTYITVANGRRLCWWPKGKPNGRLVSVLSSRLSRRRDSEARWFADFRRLIMGLDRRYDILLSALGSTCHPFLQHVNRADNYPLVSISMPRESDVQTWLRQLLELRDASGSGEIPVFVSPIFPARDGRDEQPESDELLFDVADHVVVIRVRKGGNLSRLLANRVRTRSSCRVTFVHPAADGDRARPTVEVDAESMANRPTNESVRLESIQTDRVALGEPYLSHWTRSCDGAWPDEPGDQYLDELIFGPIQERTALATLRRMIVMQRILATGRFVRGGNRVVAFTGWPLAEFGTRHVFRSHLHRWDFEPYGISIDLGWLRRRGARPVIYGNDADWRGLSEDQRPFFQLKSTRAERRRRRVDWTLEQEWRHVGDVDLSQLPPDKGMVFVPNGDLAKRISVHSRWRVVVV